MKIGIITQPLAVNYGGLLQNYALQQTLIRLGHEVYTINRNYLPSIYFAPLPQRLKYSIKQWIKFFIGRPTYSLYWDHCRITKHCASFVQKKIRTTDKFKTQEELLDIVRRYNFEGYISGSDQVWRPCYSENIYNDFLDFCQNIKGVKRIAYAASFGVSNWEFNGKQTQESKRLIKLFDAVSVREDSGVHLCKDYLDVDALHVLDPTLLLEKEDYIKLTEEMKEPVSSGELFCYILDNNQEIGTAIQNISTKLSLKAFEVKAKKKNFVRKWGEKIRDYVIPSPTKWLRAFMDAKMVFTDSFHGCVFSIIFNKPFWVIGNKERGNARFDSLLKLFNLEERRVDITILDNIDLNAPIDWDKVNKIKREWQKKSLKFLTDNL